MTIFDNIGRAMQILERGVVYHYVYYIKLILHTFTKFSLEMIQKGMRIMKKILENGQGNDVHTINDIYSNTLLNQIITSYSKNIFKNLTSD